MLPEYHIFAHTKYAPTDIWTRRLWGEKRANAIVCKREYFFSTNYLSDGTKKLIYVVELNADTLLYFGHFSLSKSTRQKQFAQIGEWIQASGKQAVVCGDFNIFAGKSELSELGEKAGLKLVTEKPTFPSFAPRYMLDLFFVSKSVKCESEVLDITFSDHLPVLAQLF